MITALHAVRKSPKPDVDAEALAHKLRRKIKGEVRFDDGSRALYATDGSNYRQVPIGVVIPRDDEDVLETLALCRQFGAPITSRGCGTSLAGQCCNVAVIIDFSKYMRGILEVDPVRKLARVQPGAICDDVIRLAEEHQLTFAPAPATHAWATVGGMIGNNSCGVHSQMAGRTSDNVEELEIVTYDGARMCVGKTSEEELQRIVQQGGRRGEIYSQLRTLRDKYARLIRQRFPRIPRRVSGYNLDALLPEEGFHVARALVGSEGTCVSILEATVNLVHSPPVRALLVIGYPNIFVAGDHIPQIREAGPIGLEAIDEVFIADLRVKGLLLADLALFPKAGAFLLAEFGGDTQAEADAKALKLMAKLKMIPNGPELRLLKDPGKEKRIWHVRDSGLGATAHVPGHPENWEGWEDSAVPPEQVGSYLRGLKKLFDKYGYEGSLYGHFGQGCIHTRINFDLKTAQGVKNFRSFLDEATSLCGAHGGSLSGEHGDGQSRAEFLPKMFGPELIEAFHEFKTIWDPQWKMNPGKLVRPFRVDENLRYGANYRAPEIETHFHYTADNFSFAQAAERCVGVGACRDLHGATMCPSYMVTKEEQHSTRGRARLLFEMLQGDALRDGWRSDAVHEALDLCLACKGCKGDCPVHVDMATYKAEFLAHYYKGRLRPRHAYVFGLIHRWARMASAMPRVANWFSQSTWTSGALKWLAGIAPERELPKFAEESFKEWFARRKYERPLPPHPGPLPTGEGDASSSLANFRSARIRQESGERFSLSPGERAGVRGNNASSAARPPVILWPDTFNNFFHPYNAMAAVEVLEDAGFRVIVPKQNMCCGRPLYDYGMLKTAKRWLENILETMREEIEAGMPFVVLEPSCCSVFRDELVNLLPHNQDAKRLREQTFTLAEFLTKKAPGYRAPLLPRHALVHGHCHHNAIMKMNADQELMRRMQLDFEMSNAGCCGMAGAFGFEKGEHYEVSVKCGERALLPKAREAGHDTLILADGFSCHEQLRQQAGIEALHLACVIQLALHENYGREPLHDGEHEPEPREDTRSKRRWFGVGATAAAIAAAAGALWWTTRDRE